MEIRATDMDDKSEMRRDAIEKVLIIFDIPYPQNRPQNFWAPLISTKKKFQKNWKNISIAIILLTGIAL